MVEQPVPAGDQAGIDVRGASRVVTSQVLTHQVMEAEPAALPVERDQEQVPALQLCEQDVR